MAENIRCIGFPRQILPILLFAIMNVNGEIGWDEDSIKTFGNAAVGRFEWLGCCWELKEFVEVIHSIELISGKLDSEELTAAVLRG